MIDGNSRPRVLAVGRRGRAVRPRRAAVVWGSATRPRGGATASDSQHVPHNCTLHGTRKSNAVPTEEDKEASPNRPGEEKNGERGAAPVPFRPASGHLVVVTSCL